MANALRTGRIVLYPVLLLLVILLGIPFSHSPNTQPGQAGASPRPVRFEASQLARGQTTYPYDEQVGITFTQDFKSLAFNVTAVAQTGPDGAGPAYLLNGLTTAGYWYQVGVSYYWPNLVMGVNPGFNMNYEVFDPSGISIFPYSGGGGLQSINVNPGDVVLLSLTFSANGNVVMLTQDWNTSSVSTQEFSAHFASYFIGLPNSSSQTGFFSGLMTEEYHSRPYYGTGEPVAYTETGLSLSSSWMWMDEFNTVTGGSLFLAQTLGPVTFFNTSILQYFSSNGTAEASGEHELVTGLPPVEPLTVTLGQSVVGHPGQIASLTLNVGNPNLVTTRISEIRIQTDFGSYSPSSGIPLDLNIGGTSYHTTITIPRTAATGNHTLAITVAWQFLNIQTQAWVSPQPSETHILLAVTSVSDTPPSTPPSSGPSSSGPSSRGPETPSNAKNSTQLSLVSLLMPAFRTLLVIGGLGYVVSVLLAVIILAKGSETKVRIGPRLRSCLRCGTELNPSTLFCPSCGLPASESMTGASIQAV